MRQARDEAVGVGNGSGLLNLSPAGSRAAVFYVGVNVQGKQGGLLHYGTRSPSVACCTSKPQLYIQDHKTPDAFFTKSASESGEMLA